MPYIYIYIYIYILWRRRRRDLSQSSQNTHFLLNNLVTHWSLPSCTNCPEIWQVLVTREVNNYSTCCNVYVLEHAQGEGDGAAGLRTPLKSNFKKKHIFCIQDYIKYLRDLPFSRNHRYRLMTNTSEFRVIK